MKRPGKPSFILKKHALGIKLDEAELRSLTEHYRPRPIMAHT
jgi:hypothetical protein